MLVENVRIENREKKNYNSRKSSSSKVLEYAVTNAQQFQNVFFFNPK